MPRSLNARPPGTVESLESRQLMAVDIAINTAKHYQTIDGFGTSLGGATSMQLLQSKGLAKLYWEDLGSSMLRVDLHPHALGSAANGWATPVTMGPSLQRNIRAMNWSNWDVLYAGTLARASLKYAPGSATGGVKIIGSIWSPPNWMKGAEVDPISGQYNGVYPNLSNGVTSGGSLIDTPANLTQFGRYVSAYVKGFQQQFGVPLYAISIQNELAFHEPYDSTVYSPKLYVDALKAVAHWFKIYGITTKLVGPEDVGVGSAEAPFELNRQMSYINAVRADKDASAALSGYAIHGYANDGQTSTRSPTMWQRYAADIAADKKFSWMTETSGGYTTWANAMRMSGNVLDSLVQGNVSAWLYWGLTTTGNDPSQDGYTLMSAANPRSPRYVAAKHFFKYIRPGAVRVATSGNEPFGIYSAAFVQDKDKTLTTVIANESNSAETVNLTVPGTAITRFDIGYESTASKSWVKLKTITMKGGIAKLSLPAQSLITLQTSTEPALPPGAISGVYFNDRNRNGQRDAGEKPIGGDAIYLDKNHNGRRDRGEPSTITNARGGYAFTNLPPGTYDVDRDVPPGWRLTTDTSAVAVISGKTTTTVIGLAQNDLSTSTIAGLAFNDTNANGRYDGGDTLGAAKTIFLDSNANGVLDSGETSVLSDAAGRFSFTGVQPGTYYIGRVFSAGYAQSTRAARITVAGGQTFGDVLIGSKVA